MSLSLLLAGNTAIAAPTQEEEWLGAFWLCWGASVFTVAFCARQPVARLHPIDLETNFAHRENEGKTGQPHYIPTEDSL